VGETHPLVVLSLSGHKDRVNSVKWLSSSLLVSISSDKSVIIWTFEKGGIRDKSKWSIKQQIEKAHEEPVNFLTALNVDYQDKEMYFATMC